jgi:hypothetical protein
VENTPKLNSPSLTTTLNNTPSNASPNIRTPLEETLIYTLLNPTTLFIILGTIPLCFLLLILGSEGTLIFTGFNITDFLDYYIDLYDIYSINDKKAKLLRYYNTIYKEIIKLLPKFSEKDKTWENLINILKAKF